MAKPGRKKRTLLFVFEILILLILLGGLFVYGQINSKLSGIKSKKLDMSKVEMNDLVSTNQMKGYTSIALFGLDSRDETGSYEQNTNSDTIIVASINNDTKEVRLCSVYRDTLLAIGKDSYGEDRYEKCNAAYAYGGPEQAVSMLNTNLDLNISDYMTVNFNALVTVIDLLGGLDIEMSGAEIVHMNNYCQGTSEITGKTYEPIEYPGSDDAVDTYHLNGVQATSYARIRYIGLDFQRTERQRIVIQKIVDKAKKSSLSTLSKIMDEVFPLVQTSLGKDEIFNMGAGMLSYKIGENTGFPFQLYSMNHKTKGDILVPTTLEYNVVQLHKFLYNDGAYDPSDTVKERSSTIENITGYSFDPKTGKTVVLSTDYVDSSPSSNSSSSASETFSSTESTYAAPAPTDSDYDSGASAGSTGGGYTYDSSAADSSASDSSASDSSAGSPAPGGSDSDYDSGYDSGADSGSDSGYDSGSDSGFDSGADSGSDSGFDSGSDETNYTEDAGTEEPAE